MRLVRYSPQERVDLPDITAMSFLPLGEFRRMIRGLLLGPTATGTPTHDVHIVRGFAAEPSAVPDALVTVRLTPSTGGGRPLAFALGGEDLGGRIDFGQLIGGEDQAGNTEGNASTSFDFTGQPLATYRLQMRFNYQAGANDNRAFWDAATNSEFIAAEDTRFLPSYELGIAVSPGSLGDDWLPIADVVWDGASIDAGDITDVRDFVFEGAAPFSAATQAANPVDDFSRSGLRDSNGFNEVYPVLRALARQIMDLKGQDEGGEFNWYQRVYGPTDGVDLLADEQTRSLRTVDTVMYTIGDGTDTFGDFNGASGLEDCLQHIEDSGANMPAFVEIVCKSRVDAAPGSFTWNITSDHALPASVEHVTIDLQGHDLAFSHNASTIAVELGSGDTLVVRNVGSATTSNNATMFSAGHLILEKVTLSGDTGATAQPVVDGSTASRISDSSLFGLVRFTNPGATASGTDDILRRGCTLERSFVSGVVQLTARNSTELPMPLFVKDCEVRQNQSHGLGVGPTIDLENNHYCHISGSLIVFHADAGDGIRMRNINTESPGFNTIRGCTIQHTTNVASTGTAYAINIGTAQNVDVEDCTISVGDDLAGGIGVLGGSDRCTIRNCKILGNDVAGRAVTESALYLLGSVTHLDVSGCVFDGWNPNTAVGNGRCIIAAGTHEQLVFRGNTFRSNGGYCIQLSDHATSVDMSIIEGNSVYVPEAAGFGFDVEGWTNGVVNDNVIVATTASSSGIFGGGTGDAVCSGNRCHNTFISTTGAVLYGKSGGGGPTNLNYET